MTATGWCEDCGDVEVEPMCLVDSEMYNYRATRLFGAKAYPVCCHYADCPICGGDVDQWAWA